MNGRLPDRVRLPVRVLFVGINPGVRSGAIGHHFAGYSNRFWKLLFDAKLVPEAIGAEVFVLPNPSGRNANFTYDEMRRAYRRLAAFLRRRRRRSRHAVTS